LADPVVAAQVLQAVSLPNCVVDRIVPNALGTPDNPLAVTVEEYFQLAIDASGLKSSLPAVPGLDLASDLDALLEQKLFTLNMAHAIIGYFGYMRGCQFVHEAVADQLVRQLLAGALGEVERTLVARHSSITAEGQQAYATKIISRFENPYLGDEVVRVARDPLRKLGPDDRLIKPAAMALSTGQLPANLATGIAAALHYDYQGDPRAQELVEAVTERGVQRVLSEVSALQPDDPLTQLVVADYAFKAL
jgi:mannitol-1-phosphate 5-dehydrogenase